MKKYSLYIIITAILLVVAIVIFLNDRPGTLNVKNNAFAIADTSGISEIQFSKNGTTLTLTRSGKHWLVNKNFHARPKAIATLLDMLMQIEIQSPVPKNKQAAAMEALEKDAVKVTIKKNTKTVKGFSITDTEKLPGTLAKFDGDDEAYIIRIAMFEGKISTIFKADPKIWRDKSIFRYNPAEIQSIKVVYPNNTKASFMYEFQDFENLLIKSFNDQPIIKINKETARGFLINFASLSYEYSVIQNTKQIFDSLQMQIPFCEITVKNTVNQDNKLKIYRIPAGGKSNNFNLNRVYAVLQSDTVPVIIKYSDLDPIMKEFADFAAQ